MEYVPPNPVNGRMLHFHDSGLGEGPGPAKRGALLLLSHRYCSGDKALRFGRLGDLTGARIRCRKVMTQLSVLIKGATIG